MNFDILPQELSEEYNRKTTDYGNGQIEIVAYHSPKIRHTGERRTKSKSEPELTDKAQEERTRKQLYAIRRKIKGYAIMNDFKWFVTLTYNPEKVDSLNYDIAKTTLLKWCRLMRDKYGKFDYLLIPELHRSGAVHFHGLLGDVPASFVEAVNPKTNQLVIRHNRQVYNLTDWVFGFSDCEIIEDREKATSYITKYITDALLTDKNMYNKKRYFNSQDLKKPTITFDMTDNTDLKDFTPNFGLIDTDNDGENYVDIGLYKLVRNSETGKLIQADSDYLIKAKKQVENEINDEWTLLKKWSESNMRGYYIKAKHMMYTQKLQNLPTGNIDNLIKAIEKTKPEKYALIIHNKDKNEWGETVEEHVHVMISYPAARTLETTARELKDKPQSVTDWDGKAENGYYYLIQGGEDSFYQYQYSPTEVIANFNYQEEIEKNKHQQNRLLNSLYRGEITKDEMEKSLTGSQYANMKQKIEDVWSKHLQIEAEKWHKKMRKSGKTVRTIWISGKAEISRIRLAKWYAKQQSRPYYITDSSSDILGNYSGEHTIIIDDFKAGMIPYPDLLRILDPFDSQVIAPPQYSNTPLACDFIIITSICNPVTFYGKLPKKVRDSFDGMNQFLSRITETIEIDDTHVKKIKYDNKIGNYKVIDSIQKDLFDSMFD